MFQTARPGGVPQRAHQELSSSKVIVDGSRPCDSGRECERGL